MGPFVGFSMLGGDGFGPDAAMTFAHVALGVGGYGFVGSASVGARLIFTFSPGVNDAAKHLTIIAVQLQLENAGWI